MGEARRDLKLEISDFKSGEWRHFPDSGYAMRREGDWTLRWDLSPLGLGTMAAHGHLDALHVSLWLRGVAMVIDPGTGAYHADKQLREHLACRTAHNGPAPDKKWKLPVRLGPFLWDSKHRDAVLGAMPRSTLFVCRRLMMPAISMTFVTSLHLKCSPSSRCNWASAAPLSK